ncbi:hypothetical protein C8Q80DRAFT_1115293 [Daedaleopsis nitida]|nr:hypothetical protein C8Q80DRAFT_1115293 [Daedaleopsis nitida]
MSRPPGCAFLGSKATAVPVHLGLFSQELVDAIIDSGSDITLISEAMLDLIANAPRVRAGQKIQLVQVTGNATITGYVPLDLFFKTAGGIVQLSVEAYVVRGMSTPFLFGNDFADQYSVSIVRNKGHTEVQFEGRSFKVSWKPIPKASTKTRLQRIKQRHLRRSRDAAVRAAEDVIIRPGESKLVPVTVSFAHEEQELLVERVFNVTRNEDDVYAALDTLIHRSDSKVPVANFSSFPARIGKGQILGLLKTGREAQAERRQAKRQVTTGLLIRCSYGVR